MATIHFKGKSYVQNHHLTLKYHHLVPQPEASLTDKVSLHDNLILQGDNLLALKALLPTYAGKVKCIYIDPPYNTGNEGWIYNDNVNSPMMQEWLKANSPVDKEDLARHDKWLCMMMPRLKLLRELLRDDGVIFVSIDDNEVHHLRMLMDEIFWGENFIASVIWQKNFAPKNSARFFSESHDYIIVYARDASDWQLNLLPRTDEMNNRYENLDNDSRGDWASDNLTARNPYSKGQYEVTSPSGKKYSNPTGTYWRISYEKFLELDKDNRIWWGDSGKNMPRLKRFLSDVKQGLVPQTIWSYKDAGHTQDAKKELLSILDFDTSADVFITPKPSKLIKRILQVATDKDSIILDSFAGSGTTAHSVLALNKEDGGNRKFILIEMEDYADSLTAERVRRVIKGVPKAKDEALKNGLGGSFSFFALGDPVEMQAILEGDTLPTYEDLARYVFYTATGDEFDPAKIDSSRHYIGTSSQYEVYLFYEPDLTYLRSTAFDLDKADALGQPKPNSKTRLVFAPMKYLDNDTLLNKRIEYCQLPFEIYK
ncbi:site-specific DNA-methyltransferase [Halomicronema sp. CCY15110]|uniref:site-specific DNA-methyltransferase n=1 Tax=Halomicronema sp. CCY15110 TaxID=2767773 RepID=UPI001951CF13|nr:site-specific DNA-methyltransferase [Halomicronema sp. CCY15110]